MFQSARIGTPGPEEAIPRCGLEKGVDINRTNAGFWNIHVIFFPNWPEARFPSPFPDYGNPSEENRISERDVEKLLGIKIPGPEIKDILRRLGFEVSGDEGLIVKVPNRRPDINIKADLIEEIARIHGYDKVVGTIPVNKSVGGLNSVQKQRREIKQFLVGLGLNEVYTYSLVPEKEVDSFQFFASGKETVSILMPITQDHKCLRKAIVPGLVGNAKYCHSRKLKDLAVFEMGKVYYKDSEYREEEMLGLLMSGKFSGTSWRGESEEADFYLLKGVLEALFRKFDFQVTFRRPEKPLKELHPGKTAEIIHEGETIGYLGCLHPEFAEAEDLDEIVVAELKLDPILNRTLRTVRFEEYSKVPSVERDIALVVAKAFPQAKSFSKSWAWKTLFAESPFSTSTRERRSVRRKNQSRSNSNSPRPRL